TSAGHRKALIWDTEFFTTDTASSERCFHANTTPVAFSTAFPAIAAITRPANALEMPSLSIVGRSSLTNQSEANGEPPRATAGGATATERATRGGDMLGSAWSLRRYGTIHAR